MEVKGDHHVYARRTFRCLACRFGRRRDRAIQWPVERRIGDQHGERSGFLRSIGIERDHWFRRKCSRRRKCRQHAGHGRNVDPDRPAPARRSAPPVRRRGLSPRAGPALKPSLIISTPARVRAPKAPATPAAARKRAPAFTTASSKPKPSPKAVRKMAGRTSNRKRDCATAFRSADKGRLDKQADQPAAAWAPSRPEVDADQGAGLRKLQQLHYVNRTLTINWANSAG
jgi:hypothetical protein